MNERAYYKQQKRKKILLLIQPTRLVGINCHHEFGFKMHQKTSGKIIQIKNKYTTLQIDK